MLEVLLSWLVIGAAAYIFGRAVMAVLYRGEPALSAASDEVMMAGMVFLNVYAQLFSLFYKVAGIACTVLGVTGIAIASVYCYKMIRCRKEIIKVRPLLRQPYRLAVAVLCILAVALWTAARPGHYDTGLYHAQAIRWIEEYGVVPGLGNLHMRLAYNSAFMCLQALFSLQWLLGDSLHTLNGFCCALCLWYAVMTVHVRGGDAWRTSDWFKCATLFYIVMTRWEISSPSTDIWAMLLVLYICTKWCEYAEGGVQGAAPWCRLCLLAFYALTLKLSAAVIVFLTVWPLYMLLRDRKGKEILKNAVLVMLIVCPFLIRNVIISGYLLYPYERLDLFSVDWKMNPAVAAEDSLYIKVYGRGFNNLDDYRNAPFLRWIPSWFGRQETKYQVLILLGALCAGIALVRLWRYGREKKAEMAVLAATVLLCLGFWMAAAPLLRYGAVWLLVVMAVACGGCGAPGILRRGLGVVTVAALAVRGGLFGWDLRNLPEQMPDLFIRQTGYYTWAATAYPIRGQEELCVWIPNEGDLSGYYYFPSTPYSDLLNHLALRGDGYEDGFRYVENME